MKETTDIWFAAYLTQRNFEIKSYSVISRGKLRLCFEISDEQWKELKLAYHNDEISKYKQTIDKIKDLAY